MFSTHHLGYKVRTSSVEVFRPIISNVRVKKLIMVITPNNSNCIIMQCMCQFLFVLFVIGKFAMLEILNVKKSKHTKIIQVIKK